MNYRTLIQENKEISNFKNGICRCFVRNIDSFSAALELTQNADCETASEPQKKEDSYANKKVLVLNFANPFRPGGGIRKQGVVSQEEDLCIRSSLLSSLESDTASIFYQTHVKAETKLASDAILLSLNVEIYRDKEYCLYKQEEENPKKNREKYVVSVLTCSAPMVKKNPSISKEELETLLYHRIEGMFYAAAHFGYRKLVLGA